GGWVGGRAAGGVGALGEEVGAPLVEGRPKGTAQRCNGDDGRDEGRACCCGGSHDGAAWPSRTITEADGAPKARRRGPAEGQDEAAASEPYSDRGLLQRGHSHRSPACDLQHRDPAPAVVPQLRKLPSAVSINR